MHDHGHTLAAVVFCLWLVALGHLAYQSSRHSRGMRTLLILTLILSAAARFVWPGLPTVDLRACRG
jgi:hypothetical protein